MAGRIRTIKPEFFDDPDIGELSPLARLLFIGLWTQADKEGRMLDDRRRFKARLFPYDAVDMNVLIAELHGKDMVRPYLAVEKNGKLDYLWIPNFKKHQRPHPKEPESLIPAWAPLKSEPPGNAGKRNGEPGKETEGTPLTGSSLTGSSDNGNGGMEPEPRKTTAPAVAPAAEVMALSTMPQAANGEHPSLLVGERVAPRKAKPVFMGARFSVFDWQVRELEATVDGHFDVMDFLFALDARVNGNGQIIPRDKVWAWLQTQIVGEARRRGLPVVATASDLSPLATRMMDAVARFVAEDDDVEVS